MESFNFKKFIFEVMIFLFLSNGLLIIFLDFVLYPALGIDLSLFIKGLLRTFIIQFATLIIVNIIIYQFVKTVNKIDNKNYQKKLTDYEKKLIAFVIIIDILGLSLSPTIGSLIRMLSDGYLMWATVRFASITIIAGPTVAVLQIMYIKSKMEKLKNYLGFYEVDYEKKSFNSLRKSSIFFFTFFGLFFILLLTMISITREEEIAGVSDKALILNQDRAPKFNGYFTELLELSKKSTDDNVVQTAMKIESEWKNESLKNCVNIYIISFILLLIFIFFVYIFITSISVHIESINKNLKNIIHLKGDLSKMIVKTRDDEIGELQVLINKLILNLNKNFLNIINTLNPIIKLTNDEKDAVNKLNENNKTMKNFSVEFKNELEKQLNVSTKNETMIKKTIELINDNVSKITNQSSMIQEIGTAQTEMTSSIQSISYSTQKANDLGKNLRNLVKDSDNSTTDMKVSIENISKIGIVMREILTTISSITEQTDILAMNAAIEAAHAGESGKGFAVVADEIRKLAENTANQTKEITNLLKNMDTAIKDVNDKSDIVSNSINSINRDVETTINLISEIDNSAKEQSVNSKQNLSSINELVNSTGYIMNNLDKQNEMNNELTALIDNLNKSTYRINEIGVKEEEYFKHLEISLNDFFNYFNKINKDLNILYTMTKDVKFIDEKN